ncbi:hatching enzyme 1.2-like [Engraulis encrasicolus]|uniref:hatching enzyme 1.2-like n=1 Tax=Engraulis encrasicolus TaxID=184585 RepID=UPI002FD4A048
MDLRPSISLLLLLLIGLSHALPVTEEDAEDESHDLSDEPEDSDVTTTETPEISNYADEETDPEEPVYDLTTQILDTNNASTEFLMEGDLVVPKTRNALACWNNQCLWRRSRSGKVEVPYTISRAFPSHERARISRAMDSFHRQSCIRFVPRSRQRAFITIENRDGCFSSLGRTGGRQVLSLNRRGCMVHGIIQHELLHALGFQHEQTRSDRDKYVKINWQYIKSNTRHNFRKRNTNNLGTGYDYGSVLHYGRYAFTTRRGAETITPYPNRRVQIGQRSRMSRNDILRLNRLYKCCEYDFLVQTTCRGV